jgi:hypothetical protein
LTGFFKTLIMNKSKKECFRHPENHISFFENRNDGDRQLSKEDETKNLNVFDKVQFVKPVKLVQVSLFANKIYSLISDLL